MSDNTPNAPYHGLEKAFAGEREEDGEREQKKERKEDDKTSQIIFDKFWENIFLKNFLYHLYHYLWLEIVEIWNVVSLRYLCAKSFLNMDPRLCFVIWLNKGLLS